MHYRSLRKRSEAGFPEPGSTVPEYTGRRSVVLSLWLTVMAAALLIGYWLVDTDTQTFPQDIEVLAVLGIARRRKKPDRDPLEGHTDERFEISENLREASEKAAQHVLRLYYDWDAADWRRAETGFKREYFTIGVGGGNTIRNVYAAFVRSLRQDVRAIVDHVRFFVLEASTGEPGWISPLQTLEEDLFQPLVAKIIRLYGATRLARKLDVELSEKAMASTEAATIELRKHLIKTMVCTMSLKRTASLEDAQAEAAAYQKLLRKHLGPDMAPHLILTGIGKDGTIGAFSPRLPELRKRKPGVVTLTKQSGKRTVYRMALNRGILTGADHVVFIVSGSNKLLPIARFNLDDEARLEQLVQEIPLNMFRPVAKRIKIFADQTALYFKEEMQAGNIKAEVREGTEENGITILKVHGFTGLYTFIGQMVALPMAWTVKALHRGREAKHLDAGQYFVHIAEKLRLNILAEARRGHPVPVSYHSMGSIVANELLCAIDRKPDGSFPVFEELNAKDRRLIEALQIGGVMNLAGWEASDILHSLANLKNLKGSLRKIGRDKLFRKLLEEFEYDYTGPEAPYSYDDDGRLQIKNREKLKLYAVKCQGLLQEYVSKITFVRLQVNVGTLAFRILSRYVNVSAYVLSKDTPHALRLIAARLLGRLSFYGTVRELASAMHDPLEYMDRHIEFLERIVHFDIPYLSIVHEDDSLVSAKRHQMEHRYLLKLRKAKEGVSRESQLTVPVDLLLIRRTSNDAPWDPFGPHLLVVANIKGKEALPRKVTVGITNFVHSNVYRAMLEGRTPWLGSVERWTKLNAISPPRSSKPA